MNDRAEPVAPGNKTKSTRIRTAPPAPPPRPSVDARLTHFTSLLDAIAEGERALEVARQAVEQDDPIAAERELSGFLSAARPALDRAGDLPGEYVDLLGRTTTRALVARAAARTELSFRGEPAADALRQAARADVAQARALPALWLDAGTQMTLTQLQRVLELAAA